jgi:hypothetical protein
MLDSAFVVDAGMYSRQVLLCFSDEGVIRAGNLARKAGQGNLHSADWTGWKGMVVGRTGSLQSRLNRSYTEVRLIWS